ncbi:uncharacterized protein si:ch1073-67j19.1 [Electrophorus electricus]|uniref:Thiaminase I, tandem duplicate 1 n=1 Tax=Electrophorus electricus TaxID=8005 RepID=A0A4W4EUX8_ELEEL|nr:uncharacterized protein si:ch1073-67j19.1 [Electrophorus electricus]
MKSDLISGLFFLVLLSYSPAFKQLEDVYEYLWESNMHIANKTLHIDFLKQMQSGELQAERYVAFTLQDINYLLKITSMLKELQEKVQTPEDVSAFMKGRYISYKKFAGFLLSRNFLKGASQIKPTPTMKKYLADYREVMQTERDPLYFAVALLPCSRLWLWLANKLDIPSSNAYYTWKKENMEGHPEKHYKAMLNKYLNTSEKVQKASNIFKMQMQNEHDFFGSS